MNERTRLLWLHELAWWAVTAIVVWAILWPIFEATSNFPFWRWNVFFIVASITLARHVFLLEHTFIAKRQAAKIIGTIVVFPIAIAALYGLNRFLLWITENDFEPIFGHLSAEERENMSRFVWNEMIFFGVGTMIGCLFLLVRLVISLWRTHNLDKA